MSWIWTNTCTKFGHRNTPKDENIQSYHYILTINRIELDVHIIFTESRKNVYTEIRE